jgi:hypothetical protein
MLEYKQQASRIRTKGWQPGENIMRRLFAALVLMLLTCSSEAVGAADWGHFTGTVVTEWLPDGRKMKLREPFVYMSPTGEAWSAPKGSIVDGASIPPIVWGYVVGGPYEGKFRDASVIHDVACVVRTRSWQATHRAFYTAMLARGEDPNRAKIMYGVVYQGGPRWDRTSTVKLSSNPNAISLAKRQLELQTQANETVSFQISATDSLTAIYEPERPGLTQEQFDRLRVAIESQDMTLEEIENFQF